MINTLAKLFIAGLAVGCVGSAVADNRHHRHESFPKDVDAFHAVLAPIWHAAPGKDRSQRACAKANEMEGLAKDIRSGDASSLTAAVAALQLKCQGSQQDVDAALFDVHEAFHRLIESTAVPGRV